MADKTKAQLQVELKAAEKKLAKAEKSLAKAEDLVAECQSEAETGVAAAQSHVDALNKTVTRLRAERNDWRKVAGGSSGMRSSERLSSSGVPSEGHVCKRTRASLGIDKDVYATEKRLRSERNAWRSFSGGTNGQRGPEDLQVQVSEPVVEAPEAVNTPESAFVPVSAATKEHVVRIIISAE